MYSRSHRSFDAVIEKSHSEWIRMIGVAKTAVGAVECAILLL